MEAARPGPAKQAMRQRCNRWPCLGRSVAATSQVWIVLFNLFCSDARHAGAQTLLAMLQVVCARPPWPLVHTLAASHLSGQTHTHRHRLCCGCTTRKLTCLRTGAAMWHLHPLYRGPWCEQMRPPHMCCMCCAPPPPRGWRWTLLAFAIRQGRSPTQPARQGHLLVACASTCAACAGQHGR